MGRHRPDSDAPVSRHGRWSDGSGGFKSDDVLECVEANPLEAQTELRIGTAAGTNDKFLSEGCGIKGQRVAKVDDVPVSSRGSERGDSNTGLGFASTGSSSEGRVASTGSSSEGRVASTGSSSEGFLVVGEMSRMGRGMHTTTTVKLIQLPGGGLLADTPGKPLSSSWARGRDTAGGAAIVAQDGGVAER